MRFSIIRGFTLPLMLVLSAILAFAAQDTGSQATTDAGKSPGNFHIRRPHSDTVWPLLHAMPFVSTI